MDRFPIGFWNYVDLPGMDRSFDATCVKDWADAGMTLTMSPNFGPEEVDRMRSILDAAHECRMRLILCHYHGYWPHLVREGEEAYRRDFAAAVKALGDHPAAFGFHVGDEPGTEDFEAACRAMRIQKEMAPHLTPFLNLLPWYKGVAQRVGFESWAQYLDAYVRAARPEFLCYDCYSQMNPGTEGWDMYFTNLREFSQASERNGTPFWTTLLSVGHFRYRCPKEDDLRWQLNTALAHGARGILWFFFYMRRTHDNYRVSPIDEHWERTETFAWLSRVNRTFLKTTAPVLKDLKLRRVSHTGAPWGGLPAFDGAGLVAHASASHGGQLIVSEFVRPDGAEYVMVVNNSQADSTCAQLRLAGPQRARKVGWMAREEAAFQRAEGAETVVEHWLAPGQMELFRVEKQRGAADDAQDGREGC